MDTRENIIRQLLGKTVHVVVDRPIGYQHGEITYPINYGYIPGVIAGDGEEQDVYILGVSEPVSSFDGRVIAAVCRKNDCEDKLVVAPEGMFFHQGEIAEAVRFQEQYFDSHVISLLHKSCGVLPWRMINGELEYLIVFQQFSRSWSLPKGHMEAGETETETALRELFEEAGLTAKLDAHQFATIEYPISPIARKQVVIFPGQVTGTPRIHAGEIADFKWVKAEKLKDYLFADMAEACRSLVQK